MKTLQQVFNSIHNILMYVAQNHKASIAFAICKVNDTHRPYPNCLSYKYGKNPFNRGKMEEVILSDSIQYIIWYQVTEWHTSINQYTCYISTL